MQAALCSAESPVAMPPPLHTGSKSVQRLTETQRITQSFATPLPAAPQPLRTHPSTVGSVPPVPLFKDSVNIVQAASEKENVA